MRRDTRRMVFPGMAIVSIVILAFVFRGSLSDALAFVQRPLAAAGTWVGNKTVGAFDAATVSPERVAKLEAERDQIVIDHAELERLRAENQELRTQLGFLDRRNERSVACSIVSRSIGPDASAFVIDRGTDDGVAVGYPAVSGDGILIGKVVSASSGSATVRVISDRDSATAVTLLNGTRTIGIAEGMSGALLSLRYIPQDERIEINDIVVTSGLESNVPSGLVVGIVNAVTTDATAPFQSAVLEPLGDARRLGVVSVLLPDAL